MSAGVVTGAGICSVRGSYAGARGTPVLLVTCHLSLFFRPRTPDIGLDLPCLDIVGQGR